MGLVDQIGHANLSNTGVSLCNVPSGLCLWSYILEWVLKALQCFSNARLERLDGLNAVIDLTQFEVTFVRAVGVVFNGLLEDLTGLLDLVVLLEQVGIAHHDCLVERVLVVGKTVEILSFVVVEFLIFLFAHLEELLEGETFDGFALFFVHCRVEI